MKLWKKVISEVFNNVAVAHHMAPMLYYTVPHSVETQANEHTLIHQHVKLKCNLVSFTASVILSSGSFLAAPWDRHSQDKISS